jgi:hypothetical protein
LCPLFDVWALLNGVDVAERGKEEQRLLVGSEGMSIFIGYAHKDDAFRAELDAHVKLFQRMGLREEWDD